MSADDPTLTVLVYSSFAAFAAALGALPQAVSGRLPLRILGWGNALAAGLVLGVAFVRIAHRATGVQDLDLNRLDDLHPAYGYQVVLVNVLHGAYEGVAIGAAMLVSLPFGISMALALAVHNVPEAMAFTAILESRGVRLRHAAALAVATNSNQVLVSVVVFVVVGSLPVLLPWAIGFAVGALLYLLLSELLPESYSQAGHTSIALVTLVAMGIVVALAGAA